MMGKKIVKNGKTCKSKVKPHKFGMEIELTGL